jgi:hypothetical protein
LQASAPDVVKCHWQHGLLRLEQVLADLLLLLVAQSLVCLMPLLLVLSDANSFTISYGKKLPRHVSTTTTTAAAARVHYCVGWHTGWPAAAACLLMMQALTVH